MKRDAHADGVRGKMALLSVVPSERLKGLNVVCGGAVVMMEARRGVNKVKLINDYPSTL